MLRDPKTSLHIFAIDLGQTRTHHWVSVFRPHLTQLTWQVCGAAAIEIIEAELTRHREKQKTCVCVCVGVCVSMSFCV